MASSGFVFFLSSRGRPRGAACFNPSARSLHGRSNEDYPIEKANAGYLTNFQVLDYLKSRGAKTDPMGCLGAVSASECKVYEYLLKTPACNQTKESILEFAKRSESFKLAEADRLNVINWRPSSPADAYAMIESCGRRFSRDERGQVCSEDERVEELLQLVKEVLPPPPRKVEKMVE
ncbi:hypothetical protein ACP4OV_020106 [Aristida adscensionis]